MKITVRYSDGAEKSFDRVSASPEAELAVACYRDNAHEVKAILQSESQIDLNAAVKHSPTRGNGTPLVLTGLKEIASLLIENGANVNEVYNTGSSKITALDSAMAKLHKQSTEADADKKKNIEALIVFLKENGGKTYAELEGERR